MSSKEDLGRRYRTPVHSVADPVDLATHLPTLLNILSNRLLTHAFRLYSSKFGLPIADWRILTALAQFAPTTYNDIAVKLAMDRAGVSRAVASLRRRGLIQRHTDPKDRRHSVLFLTRKGVALYEEIVPHSRARQERLKSALTPREIEKLYEVLGKLQQEVDRMLAETEAK